MKFRRGKPVEIKVEGVHGQDCKALSRPFEQLIGGRTVSDTDTEEIHLAPITSQTDVHIQH